MGKLQEKKHLHKLTDMLINIKNDIGKKIFLIGEILNTIRTEELWQDEYDSFEAYLGSPELSFSRSWAEKAITLYKIFVVKYCLQDKIIDIDSDKLYYICSVVDKDVDMWIEKARTLSRSDLRFEVNKAKGIITPDPSQMIIETIRQYLYEFIPKEKKKSADELELEELLYEYEMFRRR